MTRPERSSSGLRRLPKSRDITNMTSVITAKMPRMTRAMPPGPKNTMAMVGMIAKVAPQGTAQLSIVARRRWPQESTTRVPVTPAMVQPRLIMNGMMTLPCRPRALIQSSKA